MLSVHFFPTIQRLFKGILIITAYIIYAPGTAQEDALSQAKKRLSDYQGKENDTTYINILIKVAYQYLYKNSDSAFFWNEKGMRLSKMIDYPRGIGLANRNYGLLFTATGDYAKAISYHEKALETFEWNQHKKDKLQTLNHLSNVYSFMGNYPKCISTALKGIELAEKIDDYVTLSYFYGNLAQLYSENKYYEEAGQFFEQALKYDSLYGDRSYIAETKINIAEHYNSIGSYDKALQLSNESILVFEENQLYDWLKYAYMVKGNAYRFQKKYKWALHWYDQAKLIHEKMDDQRDLMNLYLNYGKVYLSMGNFLLAEEYAEKSYRMSVELSSILEQKLNTEILYKINRDRKDFENALRFLETYQKLSDSISNVENKNSLAFFRARENYEAQKKALEEENKRDRAKQQSYLYIGLFILCTLLSIAILLYINKRKLTRLYDELKSKSDILLQRESQLEKMDRTKNRIFSIIGHDLRGPIGGIQGLLELFSDNALPKPEFDRLINKLKNDIDNVLFSLNNLLSWGQALLTNQTAKKSIVHLQSRVEDSIALLHTMAKTKKIQVVNELAPNAFVWVNENEFDTIVRNLLSNAIKFTPKSGSVVIDALRKENKWYISIKDTGVGMTKETIARIFTNDEVVTTFGTDNEKGNGLGLVLCKELVLKNGGRIWAESGVNKGSTFHFSLSTVRQNVLRKLSVKT